MTRMVRDRSPITRGGVRSRIERRRRDQDQQPGVEPEQDRAEEIESKEDRAEQDRAEEVRADDSAPSSGKLSDRLIRRRVEHDPTSAQRRPGHGAADEDGDRSRKGTEPTRDEAIREQAAREQAARDAEVQAEAEREQAAARAEAERRQAAAQAVADRDHDDPIGAARRRFGGFDAGATTAGMFAALGVAMVVGSLVAAVGSIGYQLNVQRDPETLWAAGFVAGLATLAVAFIFGGWVAGRIARYDGGLNGLTTAFGIFALAAVLSAASALLGESFDLFRDLRLPNWLSEQAAPGTVILGGLIAVVTMLVASLLGGKLGDRYHRRADRRIASSARDRSETATVATAPPATHRIPRRRAAA